MMSTTGQETADLAMDDRRPAKRLKMISKACDACKAKKSRCDSSRPQCETCRRKGTECIYQEKGQPGLRPGYGKGVEQRLQVLEETMMKMNQTIQEVLGSARAGIGTSTNLHPRDARDMVDAASDPQLWQTSQPLDVSSLISTPPMEQLPWTSIPPSNTHSGLPSEEILHELIELFFESVYPWFRLFYKSNFVANVFSPDRKILLYGVVALSFRFWKKQAPSVEMRDQYVKAARNKILLHCVDTCTIISTQALTLLAIDAFGQGPGPRTWSVMAMLVAAAQQLGLAKAAGLTASESNCSMVRNEDPDESTSSSNKDLEEKRRLFWAIYTLDRFSSLSNGSTCAIDPKSIRLRFPVHDKDWGQSMATEWSHTNASERSHIDSSTNLWRCQLEVLGLSDRTHQLLLQPINLSLPAQCQEWQNNFRRLDKDLSTWFENLPREVHKPPTDFDPMWIMVHATFHAVIVRMHTIAAFPSTTSPYFRPYPSSCGRCRQSIMSVESLATRLEAHELEQMGPIFAFIVWCAARSLIILWTAGYENTYGSTPAGLISLLGVLRQISTWWQCARRYADTIQFILDTKNKPDGTAGLKIFNDTRRTVYGLHNRLGTLVAAHNAAIELGSLCDFLDVPVPEEGGFSIFPLTIGNELGALDAEFDGEWM